MPFLEKFFSKRVELSDEEKEKQSFVHYEQELNDPQRGLRIFAIIVILLIMYNACVFTLPFQRTTPTFWISYVLTTVEIPPISFAMWAILREGKVSMNKFYKTPAQRALLMVLSLHILCNFLMMTVFVTLAWTTAVFVHVLILCGGALLWLVNDSNSAAIKQQDEAQEKDTATMFKLRHRASRLPQLTNDPKLKATLTQLSKEFLYSDPVGTPRTEAGESKLLQLMENLETSLNSFSANGSDAMKKAILEQCSTIFFELDQRNNWCIKSK